jgi:hypothetical protein
MPKFVNTADHPIRVKDDDGTLRRLRPGQVVEADGKFADALKGTSGVEAANQSHEKAYADSRAKSGGPDDEPGPDELQPTNVGPALAALSKLTVSDPLNVVRGDDAAPHGPGTGTISTRAEVHAEGDVLDKLAFGNTGLEQSKQEGATGQTAKEPERLAAELGEEAEEVGAVVAEQTAPSKRTPRQRRRADGTTAAREREQQQRGGG